MKLLQTAARSRSGILSPRLTDQSGTGVQETANPLLFGCNGVQEAATPRRIGCWVIGPIGSNSGAGDPPVSGAGHSRPLLAVDPLSLLAYGLACRVVGWVRSRFTKTAAASGGDGGAVASAPAGDRRVSIVGDPGSIPGHPRHSFAVTYWGLDGVREHWTPGNRRTGKQPTEKRAFATEAEARTFIVERPHLQAQSYRGPISAYRCSVCGEFHIGRKERR